MYRTKDQVASEFIAEGKRRNVSDRGIVICIATGLVESNLTVYANSKVPASLVLPHDAVGSDGFSVGPLQQQVRDTGSGWWWGDAATCMDPTKSAGLFYDRLVKKRLNVTKAYAGDDYNTNATTMGGWAQLVQSSAFPDRYDKRMADAQAIFDRLSSGAPVTDPNRPDFNEINQIALDTMPHASVRSRLPINFFLHTQEGDGDATSLAAFLRSTSGSSAVSYHYTIRQDLKDNGVTLVDVEDTDLYSWSVLSANVFSVNLCFAGSYAAQSRDVWMKQSKAIDVAAYIAVQDAKKYNFSTEVIKPPYGVARQGISDHKYVTECLGIGSHHDVGDNFPWDVFEASVKKYSGVIAPPSVPGPTTPPPGFTYPSTDVMVREIWEQLRGPQAKGWPQLDNKSAVDALAVLLKGK